jgi:hypothetical protein
LEGTGIALVSLVDRHRVDADPDPKHFFTKIYKNLLTFIAVPVHIVFTFYPSLQLRMLIGVIYTDADPDPHAWDQSGSGRKMKGIRPAIRILRL